MFIVWGTKVVRKDHGRTADFCTLCRDFRPHRVVEVQSVGHLYYIPLGRRTGLGIEQTCESCGLLRTIQTTGLHPPVSRDRRADIADLLAETNPEARRRWADRLAFEERVRGNRLNPDERIPSMLESFLLANTLLVNRSSAMRFDLFSGLGCVATIAGFALTAVVADSLLKAGTEAAMTAAGVIGGVLALITLILIATEGRRYTRRVILPIIVRAVRPLHPTAEEIETVLTTLKAGGAKLGKVLKTDQIVDTLTFAAD